MRYRKKPVVIDAIQWTGDNFQAIVDFANNEPSIALARDTLTIDALEGRMSAIVGDWIIRGIAGEYYPCKNDIFEATYELVSETTVLCAPTVSAIVMQNQEFIKLGVEVVHAAKSECDYCVYGLRSDDEKCKGCYIYEFDTLVTRLAKEAAEQNQEEED